MRAVPKKRAAARQCAIVGAWCFLLILVLAVTGCPDPVSLSDDVVRDIDHDLADPGDVEPSGVDPFHTRPGWTWSGDPVDGTGVFRFRFNGSEWNTLVGEPGGTYTYSFEDLGWDIFPGTYLFEVQERNSAGNWSLSCSCTTVIQVRPPVFITVPDDPTNNRTPAFEWGQYAPAQYGATNLFSYRLQRLESGTWQTIPGDRDVDTTVTSYVVVSSLTPGTYRFGVSELNQGGSRSAYVYHEFVFQPATVTYHGNGHTSGSPPRDTNAYGMGDEVTVRDIGSLVRQGYTFSRWNTAPDGSGTSYLPGETFAIGLESVVLYAQWEHTVGERVSHDAGGVVFHLRIAPAATFPTGWDDTATGTVDTPFLIGETEVTYELWYTVRTWAEDPANGYVFLSPGQEGSHGVPGASPTAGRYEPVTNVSWRDVIVWLNALSEYSGFTPVYWYQNEIVRDAEEPELIDWDAIVREQTDGFRLPSNLEWSLAARYIGSDLPAEEPLRSSAILRDTIYWTPGQFASGAVDNYLNEPATLEAAWMGNNSGGSTQPVGQKPADGTGLGLYDMSGNVWEWTFTAGNSGYRVSRGGCFNEDVSWGAIGNDSYYFWIHQGEIWMGFRISRDL